MTSGGVVSMVEFGEYVECLEWLEYNGVSRMTGKNKGEYYRFLGW